MSAQRHRDELPTAPIAADEAITATILALLAERRPEATICPSDVARALAPDDEKAWRALMPEIRRVAGGLAAKQQLKVTRRGVVVDAESRGGPIRLGRLKKK